MMDYFAVLRHILTRKTTTAEVALFALAGFHVVEGRLDPRWPMEDAAILVDTNGGGETGGTKGHVINPTLEIWHYGPDGSQSASKALEAALSAVLNGALTILTDYGTLLSAVRERPATIEYDPDMARHFFRATYRTRFKSTS